jgi:hypothetical protein
MPDFGDDSGPICIKMEPDKIQTVSGSIFQATEIAWGTLFTDQLACNLLQLFDPVSNPASWT